MNCNNRNTNPFKYYIHWSFYSAMKIKRNVSYLYNYYFLERFLTIKSSSNLFYFPELDYRLDCSENFAIMMVYNVISWFYRCFWCHQRSNPLFWIKKNFACTLLLFSSLVAYSWSYGNRLSISLYTSFGANQHS